MKPTASRFLTHLDARIDDLPYVLRSDLIYDSMRLGARIVVPAGFSTDLASIPRLVQPLIPKEGKYNRPAVVHDYLYAMGGLWRACEPVPPARNPTHYDWVAVDRGTADAVLKEACLAVGVDGDRSELIYAGVRLGGWWPWWKYRRAERAEPV